MTQLRRCTRCSVEKPHSNFYRKADGRDGLTTYCKPCFYARQRERDPLHNFKSTLNTCKHRAAAAGLAFTITLSHLLPLPTVCPVLGMPLEIGPKGGGDSSPSIDRIRPSLGYVPGNVHVISLKANRIKNDATPEELARVASYFRNINNGNEVPQLD